MNIIQSVELGTSFRVIEWTEPTATDISGTVILDSQSHTSGSAFPVGVTTVTYIFTDGSNNDADPCVFTITIVEGKKYNLSCDYVEFTFCTWTFPPVECGQRTSLTYPDKRKQLLKMTFLVNEQNASVMYIAIYAISLCLDLMSFSRMSVSAPKSDWK